MMHFDSPWGRKPLAKFAPKKTNDLRECLKPLIGEVVEWRYVGTGGDDEPFPGQQRWTTDDVRFAYFWVPTEDLEEVPRP